MDTYYSIFIILKADIFWKIFRLKNICSSRIILVHLQGVLLLPTYRMWDNLHALKISENNVMCQISSGVWVIIQLACIEFHRKLLFYDYCWKLIEIKAFIYKRRHVENLFPIWSFFCLLTCICMKVVALHSVAHDLIFIKYFLWIRFDVR